MADDAKIDKVWAALAQYGIKSEKELDKAMRELKPLNISCMVSRVNTTNIPNSIAANK